MAHPSIRRAFARDCIAIEAMIDAGFVRHLQPEYEVDGALNFRAFAAAPAIAERLEKGNLGWVADDRGAIIGYIELEGRHIRLLFVHPNRTREGVARDLLNTALAALGPGRITVNSSPFAVKAYGRLGFRPSGGGVFRAEDGIRFLPMVRG